MLALQSLVSWMSGPWDYTKPCFQCISYTNVLYSQLAIFNHSCPSACTCLARNLKLYICYYTLIVLTVMMSKVIPVFHSSDSWQPSPTLSYGPAWVLWHVLNLTFIQTCFSCLFCTHFASKYSPVYSHGLNQMTTHLKIQVCESK